MDYQLPFVIGYVPCRVLTGPDFQSVFNMQLWASNAKLINYYMFFGYSIQLCPRVPTRADVVIIVARHGVVYLSLVSIRPMTMVLRYISKLSFGVRQPLTGYFVANGIARAHNKV